MRMGSKSIPGKNTRIYKGRPLFAWAIKAGHKAASTVYVSTEDESMREMVEWNDAKFILRPLELAQDDTPMLPVVQHALSRMPERPDVILLLQPTSPWRRPQHLFEALQMLQDGGADSVVSVVEIPQHYSPDFAFKIDGHRLLPFHEPLPARRQDCRPAYSRDGTVYALRPEVIDEGSLYGRDCRPLIIPATESVNLDTEEDWLRAQRVAP